MVQPVGPVAVPRLARPVPALQLVPGRGQTVCDCLSALYDAEGPVVLRAGQQGSVGSVVSAGLPPRRCQWGRIEGRGRENVQHGYAVIDSA